MILAGLPWRWCEIKCHGITSQKASVREFSSSSVAANQLLKSSVCCGMTIAFVGSLMGARGSIPLQRRTLPAQSILWRGLPGLGLGLLVPLDMRLQGRVCHPHFDHHSAKHLPARL